MPRSRRIQVDPELLKEIEDLEQRIREDDRKTAEVMSKVDRLLERLDELSHR